MGAELSQVTDPEIELMLSVFNKIKGLQNIPQKIFDQFQRVFGGTSLEVVPFYIDDDGEINVFLIKRSATDTFWPNEEHVPGTMVFAWDVLKPFFRNGFHKAWERLKGKEFMKQIPDDSIIPSTVYHIDTRRGAETACIHIAVVDDTLKDGKYYKITELPSNLVEHHLPIIVEAARDLVGAIIDGHYVKDNLDELKQYHMLEQISKFK